MIGLSFVKRRKISCYSVLSFIIYIANLPLKQFQLLNVEVTFCNKWARIYATGGE